MRDDLLIPCDRVPGLLRRGSPVVWLGSRATVLDDQPVDGWIAVHPCDQPLIENAPLAGLALDLSDATGRFHAVKWLAKKEGREFADMVRWGFGSSLYWPHGDVLSDLDPTSDARLPDGSRLVDAQALARVVLARAGVGRG